MLVSMQCGRIGIRSGQDFQLLHSSVIPYCMLTNMYTGCDTAELKHIHSDLYVPYICLEAGKTALLSCRRVMYTTIACNLLSIPCAHTCTSFFFQVMSVICRFIPLLFSLLSSSSETLKGAAADVLTEIITKRMEPQSKLALIQQLGLSGVCAQWGNGLPVQEEEYELATKYARMLAAIVTGKHCTSHFHKQCHPAGACKMS